jgi:tRNA threonylcarbamoyladenosine biosynthesis protein TsaB
MLYFLHIDTSGAESILAVSAEGRPLSVRTNADTRNQGANINGMIEEVLKEAGITVSQLTAVAVCAGPGSYTGLRIGMATAKALCYVSDIPLIADNKLSLLAKDAAKKHPGYNIYMAVLVAREKEYFVSAYEGDKKTLIEPRHMAEEELKKFIQEKKNILITGNVIPEKQGFLVGKELYIVENEILDVHSWSENVYIHYNCNETVNLALAEPFYLKEVYTHNPKNNS